MSSFTLVHVPEGDDRVLAKVVTPQGEANIASVPYHVGFSTLEDVNTVDDLREALEELGDMPDVCIIRAEPIDAARGPQRRLLKADAKTGDEATVRNVPRDWVLLDFDSVPCPDGINFAAEPARAAEHLRGLLPPSFGVAGCVWRASSNAGLKPGIRLHMWFLLSAPVDTEQLTQWLGHLPVDTHVFAANHPHFTAHPRFNGIPDPMSKRIGQLLGSDRVVVPDLKVATKPSKAAPTAVMSNLDPFTARALRQWEADHPSPQSGADTAGRFDCPACQSAGACGELPDGKWFCFANGHKDRAPTIGAPTRTPGGVGYVGHRFEFLTCTSWRDIPERLRELGYLKSGGDRKTAGSETETQSNPVDKVIASALETAAGAPPAPTVRDLDKARRELAAAEKVVRASPGALRTVAEALGRLCPAYLDTDAVRQRLVDAAVNGAPRGLALTAPDAETVIDGALKLGAAAPKVPRARAERAGGAALQTDEQGNLIVCYANVLALCAMPDLARCVAYNELTNEIWLEDAPWVPYEDDRTLPRQIDDADLSWVVALLANHYDYPHATTEQVFKAICTVASERIWNPVQQYLEGCVWDGTVEEANDYLREITAPLLGCEPNVYNGAVFMRWCIAAVQRAFEPGCQWREIMTLIGPQRKGKSTVIRELCPDESWFLEDLEDFRGRESKSVLRGKWLGELSEVDKATTGPRADAAALKSFASRRVDRYRTPWDKFDKDHPRRCILFATANTHELLTDPTGNTRFNVIDVQVPDALLARAERDNVWAAARTLFEAGEPAYLQGDEVSLAERAQNAHYARTDVEEALDDLWTAAAPSKARSLPISGGSKGFVWHPTQVGADGCFLWLTGGQVQDYLRDRGMSGKIGRSVAGALRHLGLERARTSRTAPAYPRQWAWGKSGKIPVGPVLATDDEGSNEG